MAGEVEDVAGREGITKMKEPCATIYCGCERCRPAAFIDNINPSTLRADLENLIRSIEPKATQTDMECALILLVPLFKSGLGQDPEKIAEFLGIDATLVILWAKNLRENAIWKDGWFAYGCLEQSDAGIWLLVLVARGLVTSKDGKLFSAKAECSPQPKRGLTTREWKDKKIAEGWCAHCFKKKAGENGGTEKLCGTCAADNRRRWYKNRKSEKRRGATKMKPTLAKRQAEMRLRNMSNSPKSEALMAEKMRLARTPQVWECTLCQTTRQYGRGEPEKNPGNLRLICQTCKRVTEHRFQRMA
jgi:hypothetical protein